MDYLAPSGFGNVSKNVIDRMGDWLKKNDIRLDICATNFGNKDKVVVSDRITAYNARLFAQNMNDVWYRDGFLKLLQSKPYELVWIMNDFPVIIPLNDYIKKIREQKKQLSVKTANQIQHPNFKVVFYAPIDSSPSSLWFENMKEFDQVVTYTNYAKTEIQKYKNIKLEIIPHGLDKNNFNPLNDAIALRKKYQLPVNKFIFGTVNKNHARKDIGSTLIAMATFKKKYNADAVLYLHSYHSDPAGIKIHDAAQRLGLKFNVDYFLPIEDKYKNGEYSISDMNEIYNCMDCFITTSMAEGWGLTLCEALCCELPVIYGNHTSLKEIMNGLGNGVNLLYEHIQINDGEGLRYKMDISEIVSFMKECYDKKEKIKYFEQAKQYDWEKISLSWQSIFNKLLK